MKLLHPDNVDDAPAGRSAEVDLRYPDGRSPSAGRST